MQKFFFAIAMVIVVALAWVSTEKITAPSPINQSQVESTPTTPLNTEDGAEPGTFGTIVAFSLLLIILGLLGTMSWYDATNRQWRNWKAALLEPVFMTIVGLVVINTLIFILIHPLWVRMTQNMLLFSAGCICIILMASLSARKGEPGAKWVTIAILIVFIGGIGYHLSRNWSTSFLHFASNSRTAPPAVLPLSWESYSFTGAEVPMNLALAEISKCESGGKQFNEDGTIVKNPTSSAIGEFQILADLHEKRAQEEFGLDIRTQEGNRKYAEQLYKESGTKSWEFDEDKGGGRACWGEALQKIAIARGTRKPAPQGQTNFAYISPTIGVWSETVTVPGYANTWINWESVENRRYRVRINEDDDLVFTSEDAIPTDTIQIKKLEFSRDIDEKEQRIRVYYSTAPKS